MDSLERKMDELIRLSHQNKSQIDGLSHQVADMAPTVQQVADALTFAKVGKSVFRVFMGVGIVVAPIVYFLQDRWSIVAQIFKRAT